MSAASGNNEEGESFGAAPVVFGLVNGVLIRKEHYTLDIYPELLDMAREIIRVLEIVYEQGIRKGMERGQDDNSDGSAEQSSEY